MDSLNYSDKTSTFTIDRIGFSHNGRCIRWSDIQKCEEAQLSVVDTGSKFLTIEHCAGNLKIDNWPDDAYMALRVVLKEMLPDKVKLDGPRYLKSGPGECEFVLSIAKFLHNIGLLEESKFAYSKAVELIEYYHNLQHPLLVEPLTALSSMLQNADPAAAAAMSERAKKIGTNPTADKSFLAGIADARSKKEKLVQALDEFRQKHKREPRPVEKARILKEIE